MKQHKWQWPMEAVFNRLFRQEMEKWSPEILADIELRGLVGLTDTADLGYVVGLIIGIFQSFGMLPEGAERLEAQA
jgi:hypothetical protein